MKFPSIRDVAARLREVNRSLDFETDCDVRLQVYPDGGWNIHWGDSSFDQDHRGFWGSSSLDGKRFDSRELARDLIDQCKDHHAQTEES